MLSQGRVRSGEDIEFTMDPWYFSMRTWYSTGYLTFEKIWKGVEKKLKSRCHGKYLLRSIFLGLPPCRMATL